MKDMEQGKDVPLWVHVMAGHPLDSMGSGGSEDALGAGEEAEDSMDDSAAAWAEFASLTLG